MYVQKNWKQRFTQVFVYEKFLCEHINVHRSIIHNSSMSETIRMSFNRGKDKQNVPNTFSIFSVLERNEITIHATKWMKFENIMLSEFSETRIQIIKHWGKRKYIMDTTFMFGNMKKCWLRITVITTQQCLNEKSKSLYIEKNKNKRISMINPASQLARCIHSCQ